MAQHARKHVMIPSWIFSDFVMVHSQFGFCFFKALLNRPTHSAEPDENLKGCVQGRIAHEIAVFGIWTHGTAEHKPGLFIRRSLLRQHNAAAREFIDDWSLGSLRYGSAIPEKIIQASSNRFSRNRFVFAAFNKDFNPLFATIAIRMFNGNGLFRPALCVTRNAHKVDTLRYLFHFLNKIGTLAVHAVRHDVFERDFLFLADFPEHFRSNLWFTFKGQVLWYLAFFPVFLPMFAVEPCLRLSVQWISFRVC